MTQQNAASVYVSLSSKEKCHKKRPKKKRMREKERRKNSKPNINFPFPRHIESCLYQDFIFPVIACHLGYVLMDRWPALTIK